MAAGKPIIATSIGSHRELASQAEMARLVPPADAAALCEAILQVWRDPALMDRLGASARALFESRYTEERMLNSYRQLYFDCWRAKGSGRGYRMRACDVPSEALPVVSRMLNRKAEAYDADVPDERPVGADRQRR